MTAPSRGSLALAGAASSLTLAFVPAADILREALRRLFPSTFVLVVTTACVVLAVAALALTVARLGRRRHWRRLVVLAVAAASACGYALVVATGNAEVNAVERVHLLQYGVVGALWYQVWRHHGDLRAVVLPLAASFGVGTLDELV
ncbi:MAG: hypothetical protein FJW23_15570, partial [Acidimicrobiia bacterium]|nr:hypothetical protein [Acidimicrobiia bacterium]